MIDYAKLAAQRWPNAKVLGQGRYAVIPPGAAVVYLAVDERQQKAIALGIDNPQRVDLKVEAELLAVLERMVDRHPDR